MGLEALPPKLRDALDRVVASCREAFGDALRCVILKGSALKGDFLFGYSDLDIHAFVDPDALVGDRTPTLDHALRFQEAIGDMAPRDAGASQFQVYFLRADRPPDDWTPAVPGSYAVVYGEPPPALTNWRDADFVGQAVRNLAGIPGEVLMLTGRILDKPDTSLAAYVRLAGTFVKGRAYSAAIRVRRASAAWAPRGVSTYAFRRRPPASTWAIRFVRSPCFSISARTADTWLLRTLTARAIPCCVISKGTSNRSPRRT